MYNEKTSFGMMELPLCSAFNHEIQLVIHFYVTGEQVLASEISIVLFFKCSPEMFFYELAQVYMRI